jgi:hypothetical protein
MDMHAEVGSMSPAVKLQQTAKSTDPLISELFRVSPRIGLLNQYVRKVQDVAISGMDPIYSENHQLQGFHVRAEGPAKQLKHLQRMLIDANLKVS